MPLSPRAPKRLDLIVGLLVCGPLLAVTSWELGHHLHLALAGEPLEVELAGCECSWCQQGSHCWVRMSIPARYESRWYRHGRRCDDRSCGRWRQCVSPPMFGCRSSGRVTGYWLAGDANSLRLQRFPVGFAVVWLLFAALTVGGVKAFIAGKTPDPDDE